MRELLSRLSLFVRAKGANIHFAAEERKWCREKVLFRFASKSLDYMAHGPLALSK